jgi:hypothetical protein
MRAQAESVYFRENEFSFGYSTVERLGNELRAAREKLPRMRKMHLRLWPREGGDWTDATHRSWLDAVELIASNCCTGWLELSISLHYRSLSISFRERGSEMQPEASLMLAALQRNNLDRRCSIAVYVHAFRSTSKGRVVESHDEVEIETSNGAGEPKHTIHIFRTVPTGMRTV